ncbi:MAG TPA: carboxymuconolactone decarboxylase family protein [Burkholderiales bacterium]|nr:carboxymuconolactone decarboxylase family protein [Burkholderiales bacterium]
MRGAINNACTKAEIREVLLQCAIYAGVPVMRDAVRVAQEVFAEEKRARR